MKRPPSRLIPEGPAPSPERKRLLSEDERLLWESIAAQTRPLRRKPRVVKVPAPSAPEATATQSTAAAKPVKTARQPRREPPLAPIGHRERARLSRGRMEIDARL